MSSFALGGMLEAGSQYIVMGIPIEHGRPADDFLVVNPPEQFLEIESADGMVIRVPTGNRIYPVQLKLNAGSKHTAALSALHALGYVAKAGSDVGPFLVKDGLTNLAGEVCWIKKAPSRSFGRAPKDETWELIVISDPAKMLFGGYET
jgi:hypothetical protein